MTIVLPLLLAWGVNGVLPKALIWGICLNIAFLLGKSVLKVFVGVSWERIYMFVFSNKFDISRFYNFSTLNSFHLTIVYLCSAIGKSVYYHRYNTYFLLAEKAIISLDAFRFLISFGVTSHG